MSTATHGNLTREGFEVAHDQTVRNEIETFRERAAAFLAGQISENEFRPFRLKHGIYGQRQAGVQMVRCKIPTGMLTVPQTEQLANIADEFGGGIPLELVPLKAADAARANLENTQFPVFIRLGSSGWRERGTSRSCSR